MTETIHRLTLRAVDIAFVIFISGIVIYGAVYLSVFLLRLIYAVFGDIGDPR